MQEYHVGTGHPLKTISAAAELAQPGDTIIVHEGIYREEINPPRGGISDAQRITYTAAPGEKVVIKGSEPVTGWTHVENDTWKITLPNEFFGTFNPFADLIRGDWFHAKDREHHTGAVYVDGHCLTEAPDKDVVLGRAGTGPAVRADDVYLMSIAWLQPAGNPEGRVLASSAAERRGTKNAVGEPDNIDLVGYIKDGDWLVFDGVECGAESYEFLFQVSSEGPAAIEIRQDSADGPLLGRCNVPNTGGWESWKTVRADIGCLTGANRVALVFRGTTEGAEAEEAGGPGLEIRGWWYGEVDETGTTIWAQFKDGDPNERETEINVRQTVFYPRQPGLDYITVRGFTMMHAATPWAPPTAEQIGLIGTHWSKGWIIENNTVSHSRCVGITLGKYGDEWDNRSESATAYNDTIRRALDHGWNRETVGSHLVRNNTVAHCGQAGIVGSLGCVFSTVEGNVFEDIYTHKLFAGAEMAAIKFHAAIDMVIRDNLIRRSGGGGAIWLDWMAQGTRIIGNLCYNNLVQNVFIEVNHGPFLFANNIFLGFFLRNWSQGGAYCHNILPGAIQVTPQSRQTPWHRPHSTEIAGLSDIPGGDDRYCNNLMTEPNAFGTVGPYQDIDVEGNQPLPFVEVIEKDDGVYLAIEWPETHPTRAVTTERLGRTRVSRAAFENPDGTPMRIDRDYFGHPRDLSDPGVGPFARLTPGRHEIKVWPK